MTKAEALSLARDIQSGHTRSYVQGARLLADFIVEQEAVYEQRLKDKLRRALERTKKRQDERQLALPLPRYDETFFEGVAALDADEL